MNLDVISAAITSAITSCLYGKCRHGDKLQKVVRQRAGHIHRQDYHVDEHGVQHFALPALLEAPKDVVGCHGVVTVTEEGLSMKGFGAMTSTHGAPLPRVGAAA